MENFRFFIFSRAPIAVRKVWGHDAGIWATNESDLMAFYNHAQKIV